MDVRVDVFDTPESVAEAAADLFVHLASRAISERGRFDALLSGGTTPRVVYEQLANRPESVDWQHVRLFFGDERDVPPDHPDSNFRMAREAMLDTLDNYGVSVFRICAELSPSVAATQYEETLKQEFGALPRFDLVYLGLGPDAHTASLFPGMKVIHEDKAWVVAYHVPAVEAWRITVTPPVLNSARVAAFLVTGRSKAEPVRAVLRGEHNVDRFPAQIVQPRGGQLRWMLDREAAVLIKHD